MEQATSTATATTTTSLHTTSRRLRAPATALFALLALSACNTFATTGGPAEGIGHRFARAEQIQQMRDYRACADEAMELDQQARTNAEPAKYLAAARLIERCEADLGPAVDGIALDERMVNYALSVQDYLKSGDVVRARKTFASFRTAFAGQDLYYPDGASFTDRMAMLLDDVDGLSDRRFATLNAGREVKDEIRRINRWTTN